MDSGEFRKRGYEMVDFLVHYLDTLKERSVTPEIEPGYLRALVPDGAPVKGEKWDTIMQDIENKIMPGLTHWQHPRFHAYYPAGNSYPSILGDILCNGIGCLGLSWVASPAIAELESIVVDWLGKMLSLPKEFLFSSPDSRGGGAIQTSTTESTFVSIIAARERILRKLKRRYLCMEEDVLRSRLVAYCSREAHPCVVKGAGMAAVKLRLLDPDEDFSLRGETLRKAIEKDKALGMIPFFVEATLGTSPSCAFDNLAEIGPLCEIYGLWVHVNATYAGSSFICPELRGPLKGIEFVNSFSMSPDKLLLTFYDCTVMWVKDRAALNKAMSVNPNYLLKQPTTEMAVDFRYWGIPQCRRFRALKLWLVIRSYGVEGLQKHVRNHCRLARRFHDYLLNDNRFEICAPAQIGLVCFRLKGRNELNEFLLAVVNASGRLCLVPASLHGKYTIRYCVCAENVSEVDVDEDWKILIGFASDVLNLSHLNGDNMDDEEEQPRGVDEVDSPKQPPEFSLDDNAVRKEEYPF